MNFPCKLVSAALLALAGLSPVHAIVVNSAFGAAEAAIYGSDIQFGGVVRINIAGTGICTGTLISASTILTAKHCTAALASEITVDFDLNGNGILESGVDQTNAISSIYRAPDAPGNPNLIDGTDVAMLTLSGLLPSWANALFQKLWDGSLLDSLVTTVGYGGQGVNALATNPGLSRWAAENTVDKVGAAGFNQPNSANIISTDFDNPVGQGFPPRGSATPWAPARSTARLSRCLPRARPPAATVAARCSLKWMACGSSRACSAAELPVRPALATFPGGRGLATTVPRSRPGAVCSTAMSLKARFPSQVHGG